MLPQFSHNERSYFLHRKCSYFLHLTRWGVGVLCCVSPVSMLSRTVSRVTTLEAIVCEHVVHLFWCLFRAPLYPRVAERWMLITIIGDDSEHLAQAR